MGEHGVNPLILAACRRIDDAGEKSSVRQPQVFLPMNVADPRTVVHEWARKPGRPLVDIGVRNTLPARKELRSTAVLELFDVRDEKTDHSAATG